MKCKLGLRDAAGETRTARKTPMAAGGGLHWESGERGRKNRKGKRYIIRSALVLLEGGEEKISGG